MSSFKHTILFFLIALFVCGNKIYAQQRIHYFYDAAGNRTERLQITLQDFTPLSEEEDEDNMKKMLSREDIRVYPNPVIDDLTVNLSKLPEPGNGLLQIFDTQGKLLLKENIRTTRTVVSMKDFPHAIYLMKLTFGELESIWKIVKE